MTNKLSLDGLKFETTKVKVSKNIITITLNRPHKKNAINEVMMNEVNYALAYAKQERSIRVVVIDAAGDVFCAGADLSREKSSSNVPKLDFADDISLSLRHIYKPVICKIQGSVLAGALLMVANSTHAIAVKDAKFSAPEIKRGLWPFMVMAGLFRVIPKRAGLDFIMRGNFIDASKAEEWGLINKSVDTNKLDAEVNALANELKNLAPGTMQMGLKAYEKQDSQSFDEALPYLKNEIAKCFDSDDAKEGIAAFLEKETLNGINENCGVFMNLDYGQEYESFRKEVQEFCNKWRGVSFIDKSIMPFDQASKNKGKTVTRSEWQSILINKGYFARSVPRKYGGFGGEADIIKSKIIATEFSKSNIPSAMGGQGIDMLVPTLLELGTEEQKLQFIKPTLLGEIIWCQGYSEPNAGSDLASLQTKGELIDGNWVINGQKIWTSTAQYSQMMFCLVRTEPEAKKHAGISYLLIPMDSEGIEVRPLVDMTLKAGFNEVFFTDVTIPEGNIVGKRGEGWAVANATLGHERGSLTNPNATMNRVNALIDMMKNETVNGKRLIDMPVYRDKLMKVQAKVMAFQSNSLRVLSSKLNKNQDCKIASMIQKLVGTELRHELEGLAIDVMGDLGTLYEDSPNIRDHGSWQFTYMYYLGLIIGGGTNQIQKNIISERGLGMPREPKAKEA